MSIMKKLICAVLVAVTLICGVVSVASYEAPESAIRMCDEDFEWLLQ